jgi:hypothetical protein
MKNSRRESPLSAPPVKWLRDKLRQRAEETRFLRQNVFPHPVTEWQPALLDTAPLAATEVVTVAILGEKHETCSFFVTQPFRLIGNTLFAGLQPDAASFPRSGPMRLCLCLSPEEEIETPVVLEGPNEFQMLVEVEPDLVDLWARSSQEWARAPRSISFGLALRPLDERRDE